MDELYRWETGGYPSWFLANILVWYRGHQMIESHIQDAIARKMKADAKKKKK